MQDYFREYIEASNKDRQLKMDEISAKRQAHEKFECDRIELERNRLSHKKKNDNMNHHHTIFNQALMLDEKIMQLTDKYSQDGISEELKCMIGKQLASLIERQEIIQKQLAMLQEHLSNDTEE